MLNSVFYHVGLSWIISPKNKMKYDTEEENPDWLNKGPWYNTTICSKLHGTVFEGFIRNAKTYRYNLMCYVTENDSQQATYVDDATSAVGRAIPKNSTTSELKLLGVTFNFIDFWLIYFQHN